MYIWGINSKHTLYEHNNISYTFRLCIYGEMYIWGINSKHALYEHNNI